MDPLFSLIGTAAVFLKRSLDTADGVQGRGGYTNGYGDVTSAVIKADGEGRKTVIPSETSSQPPDDLCGAAGRGRGTVHAPGISAGVAAGLETRVDVVDVGAQDDSGCGEVDTIGCVASDGSGAGVGDIVESDSGSGVNGETPNAGKRL